MSEHRPYIFSVTAGMLLVLSHVALYPPSASGAPDSAQHEVVNPHFTGKHCEECHTAAPAPGDKDLKLKFDGDDIALCNSCHEKESVRGDLHPVGMAPAADAAITLPEELPLYAGKLTCRTCHDVYLQCRSDRTVQFENIDFLWGAPYKRTIDLCFRCHDREAYKKINPHEQVDAEGAVRKQQCLYCHQSLPDPDTVADIEGVSFKTDTSTFCAACHGEEENMHPAKANHSKAASEDMTQAMAAAEKRFDVVLPVFNGSVFCGTCHNPHDQGIITRPEAARGANAQHKLRLDRSQDLCVACHDEKEDVAARDIPLDDIQRRDLLPVTRGEGIPSYHKAFLEKKCRACHSITREEPGMPNVFKMCFTADCHDAAQLLGQRYTHKDSAEGNCLLCHSQHGSQYGSHILNDQQKLCRACHPLLPPIEGERETGQKGPDLHDYYYGLSQELAPDLKMTCGFCHGEDHRARVKEKGIMTCYQCHNYIAMLVNDRKGRAENAHEAFPRFAGNNCTVCHNPHSAPYQDLLKEKPESYK